MFDSDALHGCRVGLFNAGTMKYVIFVHWVTDTLKTVRVEYRSLSELLSKSKSWQLTIGEGSTLANGVRLGQGVQIGSNVTVHEQCELRAYCIIANGVSIGANSVLRGRSVANVDLPKDSTLGLHEVR